MFLISWSMPCRCWSPLVSIPMISWVNGEQIDAWAVSQVAAHFPSGGFQEATTCKLWLGYLILRPKLRMAFTTKTPAWAVLLHQNGKLFNSFQGLFLKLEKPPAHHGSLVEFPSLSLPSARFSFAALKAKFLPKWDGFKTPSKTASTSSRRSESGGLVMFFHKHWLEDLEASYPKLPKITQPWRQRSATSHGPRMS
jgi:hypothetical protein